MSTLPEILTSLAERTFSEDAAYKGHREHLGLHGDIQFVKGARWQAEQDQKIIMKLVEALTRVMAEVDVSTDRAFHARCTKRILEILGADNAT